MPIAEMAARARLLDAKSLVEYRELPTRRWIGRCSGEGLPFEWTINPYRGCEYACRYCYARFTHEFMDLSAGEDFERRIFAKEWSGEAFATELRRIPRDAAIAIGTATDPYQPAERRYGLTRKMLEIFAQDWGRHIFLTTKSDLVRRDIGLLAEINRRNEVGIHLTITTLDRELARLLEPKAPRPDLRMEAVRELASAGIPVGVGCSPVMPGINDSLESLSAVASAAVDAGASHFSARVLFLKPPTREVFVALVEKSFPALARCYREAYAHEAYLKGAYPESIRRRVEQIRATHCLPNREAKRDLSAFEPQLPLFAA